MATKLRIKLIICLTAVLFSYQLSAQDIHFSQFNAIPSLLNPANTGFIPHKMRFGGLYRSKWNRFSPYSSSVLSAEFNPRHEKYIPENDKLGVGLLFVNDIAGADVGISTNKIMLSLAYNKAIGPIYFGLGAQGGMYNRGIKGVNHIFPDMYTGDTDAPLDYTKADDLLYGEPLQYFDLNMGAKATYYFSSDGTNIYIGAAINHIQDPNINSKFQPTHVVGWSTDLGKSPANLMVNLGSKIVFGFNKLSMTPQMVYRRQNGAQEYVIGTNFEYFTTPPRAIVKKELIGGVYYRMMHDVVLVAGTRIGEYTFQLSYEINHTSLSQAATGVIGGMEISLLYNPAPRLYY